MAVDSQEPVPGTSLEGLAGLWENDKVIRGKTLGSGKLLQWPSPEQVGVINFETMKKNCRVLEKLLLTWCPQLSYAKTVHIDQVRAEVGG